MDNKKTPKLGLPLAPDKLELSAEHKQLIRARIEERIGSPRNCEVCNSNNWTIITEIFSPSVLAPTGNNNFTTNYSRIVPSVGLGCENCGNFKMLSLIALDLEIIFEGDGDE